MQTLIKQLENDFNTLTFSASDVFMWSPHSQTISYNPKKMSETEGIWSLLHEIGHAQLGHATYHDDLELLIMEVSAWKEAKLIAKTYDIAIDEQHIDSCLETYRNWLHSRSKCVECMTHSLQIDTTTYLCHNCGTKWKVSESQLCHIRKRRI